MATDAPEWSAAEEAVMQATYRALLEHGYADLSIARIAEHYDKSKAALYYHYDSKEAILLDFLAYALDRFEASVRTEVGDDPSDDLDHVIEKLLPVEFDDERRQLQSVLVGLHLEGVTNAAFREQFTRIDDRLAATLRDVIDRGIADGSFRDVDSAAVAEYVLATVNGAMYGRATTDRTTAPLAVRRELDAYLDADLRRRP